MGMDADLSQTPEDFLKMRERILAEDDMVIGSRYIKGGEQIGKNLIKLSVLPRKTKLISELA